MQEMYTLEMRGINKSFPGVHALKDVDFTLRRGEILGLLGENGAGKSTLMKVLGGIEHPDAGEIWIDGRPASIRDPADAQAQGVSFIHQELSLFPDLDVASNIFIQELPRLRGLIREKRMNGEAAKILEKLGMAQISPREKIKNLQMGERQLVEIGRCFTMETKILVLDEPTSSLTSKEVEILFGIMRVLKEQGISIIFISHRLDEVFSICDRYTVMRDGRVIESRPVAGSTTNDIVRLMIGKELSDMFNRDYLPPGKELLRVERLCRGERFQDISFSVCEGEIVGLYGLMGSGRSEIVRSIFGLEKMDSGEISMEGAKIHIRRPVEAMEKGLGLITEDRRGEGLMLMQSVKFNLTVANLPAYRRNRLGFMSAARELADCEANVREMKIKTSSLNKLVKHLSGGNQQKVVIAKWLNKGPKALILDEPTRGVDVGAKHEIYGILDQLVRRGKGIFVISSELNEIMGLCDRILVIRKGRIVREFSRNEFDKNKLLEASMGGTSNGEPA